MLTNLEIRIGNWVRPDFIDIKVKVIGKRGEDYIIDPEIVIDVRNTEIRTIRESITNLPASNLDGIIISPKILEYFGFVEHEYSDETYWYHAKKVIPYGVVGLFYVTEKASNYKTGYVFKSQSEKICENINFFHQLQNCFLDESGVELF